MICPKCGREIPDNSRYCNECGAPLAGQPVTSPVSENYAPISMWGYFGYELLFSIPCVGFIILLIFAFGGTSNVNVKNFARSYFCYFIILAVIIGLLISLGIFGAMFDSVSYM